MATDKTKAPKWCKDAVATKRGWENEKTGELYVSNTKLPLKEIYGDLVEGAKGKLSDETGSKDSSEDKADQSVGITPEALANAEDEANTIEAEKNAVIAQALADKEAKEAQDVLDLAVKEDEEAKAAQKLADEAKAKTKKAPAKKAPAKKKATVKKAK